LSRLTCNCVRPASYGQEEKEHASAADKTVTFVDLIAKPCALERLQEYDDALLKPKPVTVTVIKDAASTLAGDTDASSSIKLTSKMPLSLSTAAKVTESTTLRMYLPPAERAAGMKHDRRENVAARVVLVTMTVGFDDKIKRQM
jgi:hypothetical protein